MAKILFEGEREFCQGIKSREFVGDNPMFLQSLPVEGNCDIDSADEFLKALTLQFLKERAIEGFQLRFEEHKEDSILNSYQRQGKKRQGDKFEHSEGWK